MVGRFAHANEWAQRVLVGLPMNLDMKSGAAI